MALNKSSLEENIKKLLDLEQEPNATDPKNCAELICNYIDEYLSAAELDPFPAAGIQPGSPPIPDAVGPALKVEPDDLVTTPLFKADLIAVMKLGSGDFSSCGPQLVADLSVITGVNDSNGYIASGASVCATPPDIDAAFNKGKNQENHEAVAAELADQIHTAVTSTTFTAASAYAKEAFVQTPPIPPYVSTLK